MKSYSDLLLDTGTQREKKITHEKSLGFRLYIKEYQGEGCGKCNPKHNETHNKSDQCRHRSEVSKRFAPQKTWKGVLFHCSEAVFLLSVKHIRDMCHHIQVALRFRILIAAKGKAVYAEGGREVYFMIFRGIYCA